MSPKPNIIFTYGTLRPGLGERPEAHAFRKAAKHIGPATFQGKLYAIDWYPGVIDSTDKDDIVIGDLFEISEDTGFFTKLDIYEMCSPDLPQPHEYIRTIRTVLAEDRRIPAWIYLYNRTITDQTRIPTGDYADHVD
ncbi:MAG: gamma-glutamylcyclotransferase family protein [Paracoccaceae bacterium]